MYATESGMWFCGEEWVFIPFDLWDHVNPVQDFGLGD
jgi:hypothetical protein